MASRQSFSIFLMPSLLLGLFAFTASAAEERTWTDTSGKTVTGKFIELTEDGEVKIEANGKTYDIPLTRFSDTDKKYVESQNKKNARNYSDLKGYRQWTDSDGNEIKARYIRMIDGDVVLMQGKTGHRVDFYKLSDVDQDYLRGALTALGEAGNIPEAPVARNVGAGLIGGSRVAAGGATLPGGVRRPGFTAPGILPQDGNTMNPTRMGNQTPSAYAPPSNDSFAAEQARRHEEAQREREKQEQQRHEEQARQQQERRVAHQQQVLPRNRGPIAPGIHGSSTAKSPQMERVLICMRCNNELPPGVGAGSSCPHCGVYIAKEFDENGNLSKEAEVPWYLAATSWSFGVPIWALGAFVVSIFSFLYKKLG